MLKHASSLQKERWKTQKGDSQEREKILQGGEKWFGSFERGPEATEKATLDRFLNLF